MQFEDILRSVGDENRFQVWLILLLLLPTSFFNAFHDSIIQMATPDHWCRVPELESLPQALQHSLIRPPSSSLSLSSGINIIDQQPTNVTNATFNNHNNREEGSTSSGESCIRYDVDYTNIRSVDDLYRYMAVNNYSTKRNIPTVKCGQDGWIYDKSLYTETAVTWVCIFG